MRHLLHLYRSHYRIQLRKQAKQRPPISSAVYIGHINRVSVAISAVADEEGLNVHGSLHEVTYSDASNHCGPQAQRKRI